MSLWAAREEVEAGLGDYGVEHGARWEGGARNMVSGSSNCWETLLASTMFFQKW